MRGSTSNVRRERATRVLYACTVVMAMLVAGVASVGVTAETADARGPEYSGEQTTGDGPAYFGPAPNPFPYCDSPTYFDPFPENIAPIGRMDVGDTARVTTNGLTMELVITAEGNPGTQYPGFFPNGADGGSNDRAKGIELAEGDTAVVSLSAPLFYSQWIFTDVDQPNEGFTVTPAWTIPGQAAVFAGDTEWTFAGTSPFGVELDDTNGVSEVSQSINGRGQVDFLGAVTGITMERTNPSNGQSGFAVGGGCEAAGAAKVVVAGPTWNGSSFDVTYELRVRNNLPSSATIQSVINDAVAEVGASLVTGSPQGIALSGLQLTDNLSNDGFTDIQVTSRSTDGGLVLNQNFDGINDLDLISSGEIAAEENEVITLSVQYTPDFAQAAWAECAAGYNLLNQTELTASAANVGVSDLSDNGISARPGDNNGEGGVDDPTPVRFPCPPGGLEIVKTVVPGPNGTCPAFDAGVVGDGPALPVTVDDVVTYCVSVRNPGPGPITNVVVADAQAPGDISLNDLFAGQTDTTSYDVTVALTTPTLNTATATADDVDGPLPPARDSAVIEPAAKPQPLLEIVKTVVVGPNGACPSFVNGVADLGPALAVDDGDTITYCISVRNSGQGDALNVIITDAQAPQDYSIGTLAPGAGRTVSYDLTVGLDTATVNVASGTYSGPDGPLDPVDDDAQIEVSPLQPDLEIVKTVLLGADATCPAFDQGVTGIGPALSVDDGGTVTYCISIRNSGLGVANGVVINDAQAPAAFTIGTLTAGQTETVQYNVTVDLTTPTDNIATATGVGPDGDLDPVSDPARIGVDALPEPVLEIVKTVLPGADATCPAFDQGVTGIGPALSVDDGGTVTYCISIRNSGLGIANGVVINDAQAPAAFTIGTLTPGQTETVQYNVTVDLTTPTDNIATATGVGPYGDLDPVSDPARIGVDALPEPVLEIVKTALRGADATCPAFDQGVTGIGPTLSVDDGGTVTYCISIRNSGLGVANGVVINDAQAPAAFTIGTLTAGQTETVQYNVTVDLTTPTDNIATATGVGPYGDLDPVSDPARIGVDALPDPVLEIVKTALRGPDAICPDFDGGVAGPGDPVNFVETETVTYCITVRNTGVGTATNVRVTDPQAPDSFDLDIGTLASGESETRSYDLVVDMQTPATNVATVNGTGPNGTLDPQSDPAIISVSLQPDPILEIVKTVVPGPDGDCPATFDEGIAGQGDALGVTFGDAVTYCITVRNVGGNDATGVTVADPQAPGVLQLGVVAVGQEVSESYDVVVDATTPLVNTATVNGNGPNGPVPSNSDDAVINSAPEPDPVLEIVKTVVLGPDGSCPSFADGVPGPGDALTVVAGQTVTYCIAIQNTGAGDAVNVQISDDQAPESPIQIGSLPAGEGRLVQYDLLVNDNSGLRNLAILTGDGPNGPADPAEDDAIIDTRSASISLIHSVSKANEDCVTVAKNLNSLVANMEELPITWCALITNNGNVPLTNVVLEAPAISDGDPIDVLATTGSNVLLPGQSVVIPVAGEIPDTGLISNALVEADPSDADGNVLADVTPPSDVDNAEVREASIDIETTVAAGADADCDEAVEVLLIPSGEDITWCFAVTNTGAVDLLVTQVVDPDLDVTASVPADQQRLPPNVTIFLQANGESADGIEIIADVKGRPLDFDGTILDQAPEVEDVDPAQVVVPVSDVQIVKSNSNAGPVSIGDTITYSLVITNNGPNRARQVEVFDQLPVGISYVSLPGDPDWACSLDDDEAGFSCLKATNLAAGVSVTLTYTAQINEQAPDETQLTNTAKVTTITPDGDPTNNEDTSTTETDPPDIVIPTVTPTPRPTPPPGIQYPGPFDPPAVTVVTPPDEVLGLAITGASSNLLGLLATALLATGGLLAVGARRSRRDD